MIKIDPQSTAVPAVHKTLLGAMDQVGNVDASGKLTKKPVNHFNGWIDELRIWDVALTEDQLHQMMNQKIAEIDGSISADETYKQFKNTQDA